MNYEICGLAIVIPCAVWDKVEVVKFNSDNKINSSIDEGGNSSIQCVTIDQSLFKFSPTYINMDVEGAEVEALYGSESTIQTYKPDLAICVYHKPEHLWRILNYIRSIVPEYQFFMRNYTGFPAETVLYATV